MAPWHQHYEDDAGEAHSPEEWEEVRVSTGRLIWRLEEAAAPAGHAVDSTAGMPSSLRRTRKAAQVFASLGARFRQPPRLASTSAA